MEKLRLALDWTPNVNHIGFLVAKELGFYHQQGIELEIQSSKEDNYAITPAKKLELRMADLAIAPSETVISFNNKPNRVEVIAIYAILQEDLSCIVTLQSSNITSPRQLDGKTYASYKARYEDHIVREMIKNDGGKGEINIIYPEKLGIWNTVIDGKADATWIFDNWEGIEASGKNIALNKFMLGNYGIPYGYSPVVLVRRENLMTNKSLYAQFVKASRAGFLFVKDNLKEAISILEPYVTPYDLANINLEKALAFTIPYFGNEATCGMMNSEQVTKFLEWIVARGLENEAILKQDLFTNEVFAFATA
jgi:ABC-type nitrate/sulfonate/bicarbonate transport system substrate-binding protein